MERYLERESFNCRLILLGDYGVGKSSIITRLICGSFNDSTTNSIENGQNYPPEISAVGVDFVNDKETYSVEVQILDSMGQEKFDALTNSYYRFCNTIIFVFDVCSRNSFYNLSHWFERAHSYGCFLSPLFANLEDGRPAAVAVHQRIRPILVGNKMDMAPLRRQVTSWEASQLADRFHMRYFEVSALSNVNTLQMFHQLLSEFVEVERKHDARYGGKRRKTTNSNNPLILRTPVDHVATRFIIQEAAQSLNKISSCCI